MVLFIERKYKSNTRSSRLTAGDPVNHLLHPSIRRSAHAFATALLVFSFAACAAAQQTNLSDKPPMKLGEQRPLIDFSTINGNQHPVWEQFKGKVVVIDFWATWCAPCIAAFPQVNALKTQLSGRPVVFYSVSYETPAMVDKVLKKFPLETQVALDNDFHTFKSFQAWAIPAVYVFDGEGRLAAEVNVSQLNADLLNTVLAGKRPTVPQQMGWKDPAGAEFYFRSLRQKGVQLLPHSHGQ
ncbi:MAG: TlpA family protein disulfide reductase [Acidobacteriota bacterium]|nr:TlpA family protein disulfide reductase [Acidobacteriota bacterium]